MPNSQDTTGTGQAALDWSPRVAARSGMIRRAVSSSALISTKFSRAFARRRFVLGYWAVREGAQEAGARTPRFYGALDWGRDCITLASQWRFERVQSLEESVDRHVTRSR